MFLCYLNRVMRALLGTVYVVVNLSACIAERITAAVSTQIPYL